METKIRVILRPSRTKGADDPGHIAIAWEVDEEWEYRGFRFEPAKLPEPFRTVANWRNYLFENKVTGHIFNDIIIQDDLAYRQEKLIERSWTFEGNLDELRQVTKPRVFGWYSFNPQSNQCHNCVTWASSIVNLFIGLVLEHVREGRIKLMESQLRNGNDN